MTTLREAAQQALEALEKSVGAMRGLYGGWRCEAPLKAADAAIHALEAALEQPEQEPFGYIWPTGRHPEFRYIQQMRDGVAGMPLYTHPPRREWRGLTEEEIDAVWEDAQVFNTHYDIARAIEQSLKEKNA